MRAEMSWSDAANVSAAGDRDLVTIAGFALVSVRDVVLASGRPPVLASDWGCEAKELGEGGPGATPTFAPTAAVGELLESTRSSAPASDWICEAPGLGERGLGAASMSTGCTVIPAELCAFGDSIVGEAPPTLLLALDTGGTAVPSNAPYAPPTLLLALLAPRWVPLLPATSTKAPA